MPQRRERYHEGDTYWRPNSDELPQGLPPRSVDFPPSVRFRACTTKYERKDELTLSSTPRQRAPPAVLRKRWRRVVLPSPLA